MSQTAMEPGIGGNRVAGRYVEGISGKFKRKLLTMTGQEEEEQIPWRKVAAAVALMLSLLISGIALTKTFSDPQVAAARVDEQSKAALEIQSKEMAAEFQLRDVQMAELKKQMESERTRMTDEITGLRRNVDRIDAGLGDMRVRMADMGGDIKLLVRK